MNMYDIVFLAIVALFLVIGLFSKLLRGLINLIMIGASIPVSYWVSGILMNTNLPTTLLDLLRKIPIFNTLLESSESLNAFINGSMRTVVFYAVGIVGLIVFKILAMIICAIVKNSRAMNAKGILSLGLFRALSCAVALLFLTAPLPILHTALKEAGEYANENMSDGLARTILVETDTRVNTSKIVSLEIKALDSGKVPFLSYKVEKDGETKTNYFYSDMEDVGKLIPSVLSMKNMVSGFKSNIDLNDSESIVALIDNIGKALDEVDGVRSNLSENGSFKGIIGEVVQFFIEKYPEQNDSLKFLSNVKTYLAGFDYENAAYKEKLPAVIIQSYIDSLESSNTFAKYIDVTNMSFDTLKAEVANFPNLMKTFNNMAEIESSTLKTALTSSQISKQIVAGMLDDYYTDDSVNEPTLDYDKECDAITSALTYSNHDDDAMRQVAQLTELVDKICDSDLLPAVIYSYEQNGNPLKVSVDDTQKAIVDGLLDAKLASADITVQQYNTYKAIFVTE